MNHLVLESYRSRTPNFIQIRSQFSELILIQDLDPDTGTGFRFGSTLKVNHLVLGSYKSHSPNFIGIRSQLFELYCLQVDRMIDIQTDKQTDKQTGTHTYSQTQAIKYLHPISLAEELSGYTLDNME